MSSSKVRDGIEDLLADYAYLLDQDKLEDWVDCFEDAGTYKVITSESFDAGMPAGMIYCDTKDMIRDRILYVRDASVANVHRDRHFLGQPRITETSEGSYQVVTNFIVYQSEPDRESRVFCLGRYESTIIAVNGSFKIKDQIVVLDNDSVTPLIATPI
jgi:anthranilate 1,2-dioxygenase small subunit